MLHGCISLDGRGLVKSVDCAGCGFWQGTVTCVSGREPKATAMVIASPRSHEMILSYFALPIAAPTVRRFGIGRFCRTRSHILFEVADDLPLSFLLHLQACDSIL